MVDHLDHIVDINILIANTFYNQFIQTMKDEGIEELEFRILDVQEKMKDFKI